MDLNPIGHLFCGSRPSRLLRASLRVSDNLTQLYPGGYDERFKIVELGSREPRAIAIHSFNSSELRCSY